MRAATSRLTIVVVVLIVAALGLLFLGRADDVPRAVGWQNVLAPKDQYGSWSDWMSSVAFSNREVGWAVGGGSLHTGIFKTEDAGDNWERLSLYDEVEHSPDFNTVRFWNESHGWISSGSLVLRTTDGGSTWTPVEVGTTAIFKLKTLLPLGERSALLGRTAGWVSLTTDGGGTWTEVQIAPDETDVSALASPTPQTIFATTASPYLNRGALYRSTDGGQRWELMIEGDKPLRGIAFSPDGQYGVAVGSEAAHVSGDGGQTWRAVTFQGRHRAVRFLGPTTVISVGERPAVLISRDAGATWTPGPAPNVGSILSDVAPVDSGWWFAAGGYSAVVLRYIAPNA